MIQKSMLRMDVDIGEDGSMNNYCVAVRKVEDKFKGLQFHRIEREHNMAVDALSKLRSSRA
jgi:hypothetical protein